MKSICTPPARAILASLFGVVLAPFAGANCLSQMHGQLVQGGLVWGQVAPGSSVTLDGEPLDVLDDGSTLLGFGRNATASAQLVVSGPQSCEETLAISARQYNIQRVEGVPQQTVTPPPEQSERIRKDRVLVGVAKSQRLQRPDLLLDAMDGFVWPVQGPISGVYGSQRVYNGTPRSPHYGVDVAVPTGTAVRAPTSGVVTLAHPDLFYSGGTIIVDHGYGLSSSFLHLSEVTVEVGQEVQTGDVIGAVGATGRATGPHLDWRMSWREQRVDPQLLVPAMPNP